MFVLVINGLIFQTLRPMRAKKKKEKKKKKKRKRKEKRKNKSKHSWRLISFGEIFAFVVIPTLWFQRYQQFLSRLLTCCVVGRNVCSILILSNFSIFELRSEFTDAAKDSDPDSFFWKNIANLWTSVRPHLILVSLFVQRVAWGSKRTSRSPVWLA